MEHAAIFIPASPVSSAVHTPSIEFRTPDPLRQGSISIPATSPSAGHGHGHSIQLTTSTPSDPSWTIPLDEEYHPAHQTTSKASIETAASNLFLTDPIETTSQYLIRLSCEFIDSINNRDWATAEMLGASMIDHSCFTALLTEFPEVTSYGEHLETYKFIYSHAPHVRIDVLGSSCEVDEMNGDANVYINARASGQPGGISTNGVSLFTWKRKGPNAEWLCTGHAALKGIEGIV